MSRFLKSMQWSCLLLGLFSTYQTEATWSRPAMISSINADLSIGMDASGNAMAVWNGALGTVANNLYYNYILKGDIWYVALPLSSTDGHALMSSPQIAIDAKSNAVVVWEELDFQQDHNISTVKAGMHPSPGEWSIVDISITKGVGRFPQVAMNASGYTVAAWRKWEQESDSPQIVQAATLQFGGEWSAPVDVSTGENVRVAVDKAGNAIAVWIDNNAIKSASLPYGGSWSSPTTLSTGEGASGLALAMNPSGYAVAVWHENAPTSLAIKSSTLQFGESWSAPIEIPLPSPTFFLSGLDVAVGHAGNTTVVWQHETLNDAPFPMPNDISIQSSYLFFKGKWSKPVRVSPTEAFCYNPLIALDGSGNNFAVWNNDTTVQASIRPFAGKWSAPTDLSSESKNSNPQIVVDSTGYAVVVWLSSFSGVQGATWTP